MITRFIGHDNQENDRITGIQIDRGPEDGGIVLTVAHQAAQPTEWVFGPKWRSRDASKVRQEIYREYQDSAPLIELLSSDAAKRSTARASREDIPE